MSEVEHIIKAPPVIQDHQLYKGRCDCTTWTLVLGYPVRPCGRCRVMPVPIYEEDDGVPTT